MRLQKGDILIALKAINLTPGIRNGDRAVAAALLDHFNRKTGQCDPGIERLAGLLGVSERTIFRSLNRIEADRLFKRTSHGGHLNRNSYEPNWQRFREIEAVWSGRMKKRHAAPTSVSDTSGQGCQLGDDKIVTQTCRRNQSKETYQVSPPRRESNREASSNSQRHPAFQTPSRVDAAHTAAQRRWHADLHREFSALPVTYGQVLKEIDQAMEAAATDAEKLKSGAGLQYICEQLGLPTADSGGQS